VAVFGYAHVPWISPHQKALEKYALPAPEQRTALFGTACEVLQDAGYVHIGMDHFALPDDPLTRALQSQTLTRNFMGYTTRRGLDLAALGASGISSVAGTYTQNIKDVKQYIQTGGIAWHKGLILTDDDRLRREIILELFCNFHLDTERLSRRFGIDFRRMFHVELKKLEPFVADGLLEIKSGALDVTGLGRYFIRNICMVFDRYLDAGRYSKTI
jgi:oxygen-independent coproporphyrinogen-3 oxidase